MEILGTIVETVTTIITHPALRESRKWIATITGAIGMGLAVKKESHKKMVQQKAKAELEKVKA